MIKIYDEVVSAARTACNKMYRHTIKQCKNSAACKEILCSLSIISLETIV